MPPAKEYDPRFEAYEHLKSQPRADEALLMLRKAASMVKPIMRKNGWKVKTLCEFLPSDTSLLGLNVNRTAKICLRLRYNRSPGSFLAFERVLDTLLHELCHIVHMAHDSKFHALWNKLRGEYHTLRSRGYTGEGFLGRGRLLGGKSVPPDELARRRRQMALERSGAPARGVSGRRLDSTAAPGPIRVSSAGVARKSMAVRRLAAEAAIRRSQANSFPQVNPILDPPKVPTAAESSDNDQDGRDFIPTSSCACGTQGAEKLAEDAARDGFRTQEDLEDANEVAIMNAMIELVENEASTKPPAQSGDTLEEKNVYHLAPTPSWAVSKPAPWSCGRCTFLNPPTYLICDACATIRGRSGQLPTQNNIHSSSAIRDGIQGAGPSHCESISNSGHTSDNPISLE